MTQAIMIVMETAREAYENRCQVRRLLGFVVFMFLGGRLLLYTLMHVQSSSTTSGRLYQD